MTDSGTWHVGFAGCGASIAWEGDAGPDILGFLFGATNGVDRGMESAHFRLVADAEAGRFALFEGTRRLYNSDSAGKTAGFLLDKVVTTLAGECTIGPVFHAGALALGEGMGLLLPGKSGAGKSTLAAWLTLQGRRYLTDELVCIASGEDAIRGFERPLHLKRPADGLFEQFLTGPGLATDGWLPSVQGVMMHATLLNPHTRRDRPAAGLIIFPQFDPDTDCRLQPLSPAQACTHLMGTVVNARNLPGHGLAEISRISRQAPAYQMQFGDLEAATLAIDELVLALD